MKTVTTLFAAATAATILCLALAPAANAMGHHGWHHHHHPMRHHHPVMRRHHHGH